jgi:hypothetical protein
MRLEIVYVSISKIVPSRVRFSLSARQSYDAFFKQYGDNIYEKPSLSGDNESVEIDRER